jgi:hypothetical protein
MTDAARVPAQVPPMLKIVAVPAASCDGEFCAIPVNHTQAVVNRKIDSDEI